MTAKTLETMVEKMQGKGNLKDKGLEATAIQIFRDAYHQQVIAEGYEPVVLGVSNWRNLAPLSPGMRAGAGSPSPNPKRQSGATAPARFDLREDQTCKVNFYGERRVLKIALIQYFGGSAFQGTFGHAKMFQNYGTSTTIYW
jgi:hypothetical protein